MEKKYIIWIMLALAIAGGLAYNAMNPTTYKHPMQR
jgi:hypothetical protein